MAGHDNRQSNSLIWRATNGKPEILFNMLEAGETMTAIAAELNVSQQAIRQYMLRVDPEAYHNARQIAADYQMTELESVAADDTIDCARARNIINVGQFKLERRYSKQYGRTDKVEITTNDITDRLSAGRKRMSGVIEADVVDDDE